MKPVEATQLEEHPGVIEVQERPDHTLVDVAFDPSVLSDGEVRELIREHVSRSLPGLQKSVYRLESHACEACALKLERKVAGLPGVRRATATFLGKVLSITFDPAVQDERTMEQRLRAAGAKIGPIEARPARRPPLFQRLRSGELNEEITCGLGLVFLIVAAVTRHLTGPGPLTWGLFLGAYLFAGQEGIRSAWASLKEKELDVDVLMVLAALGAAAIGQPFEGALLLFLFSFSNVLQRHAMDRTTRAIESLLTLRPSEALVKRGGGTTKVPVEELEVGEIVVVKPGEQIPVDGELVEGRTSVDESSLTGESMPVGKEPGSTVFAGTINQTGGISLKVTKRADDSTLARMVKLVAEAQAEKSGTQRFLETAERWYALGVILLTIAVLVVPWLLHGEAFRQAFYRAMTIMVVASPCALIISTPATVLSAIGGAARKGILIKGGSHLDRAAAIDIVAIDKTGTLTVGKPSVTEVVVEGRIEPATSLGEPAREFLRLCAALEARSEHPLAQAIVAAGGTDLPEAVDFQAVTGKGAEAVVGGRSFAVGSGRFMEELGASAGADSSAAASRLQDEGKTCVWFAERTATGVAVRAVIAMADTVREGSARLVAELKQLGVKRVVMLTGDQQRVAEAIGRETGVDEVRAGLLPEDKLKVVRLLKEEGKVLMAGDGVNDAPALAASDLGVAMGAAGTDVAMETADVVLMGDRVENLPLLLDHARRARRVLLQNLTFAASVIVVLVLAALGFALPLPAGVVGHEGSTVLVCLNGLRLLLLRNRP
ncbi:heavy metal translocating P-type ATPase [Haloferula sargassicola]|uniref:Cadmium-transporting ATPase n=1 Tax=Haloferula sargassicola TaxID=490096 RepID=A0ABP9UL32_9BACT